MNASGHKGHDATKKCLIVSLYGSTLATTPTRANRRERGGPRASSEREDDGRTASSTMAYPQDGWAKCH